MNDLKRKKIGRGTLRSHCKKLEERINVLVSEFVAEKTVELKALKMNYEKQIKKIEVADEEILGLITSE